MAPNSFFVANTLDDLLNDVFKQLISLPFSNSSTRGQKNGNASEIIGATLRLNNPLARLSRTETKGTIFSAIGELLWYLSGTNDLDFIKYYIPDYERDSSDGETIYGGYGPRLFNSQGKYDQIGNVLSLLRDKPTSRRAAIQIFESRDLENKEYLEIPCTCTLQFLIRNERLHMVVYMRSNDAFIGMPHDIFAFTMLQEIISNSLGIGVGEYIHSVGSLHLYEVNKNRVDEYLEEGIQSTLKNMPEMPQEDPWQSIKTLLSIESNLRNNVIVDISDCGLSPYWKDLAILLEVYRAYKFKDQSQIEEIRKQLSTTVYKCFIDKKLNRK